MGILYFLIILAVIIIVFAVSRRKTDDSGSSQLADDVKELDNKLAFILRHMATKYDLEQLKMGNSVESSESTAKEKIQEQTIVEELVQATPVVAQEEKIVETPIEATPIVQEATPKVAALEKVELPMHEVTSTAESIKPASVYAAATNSTEESIVSEPVASIVSEIAEHVDNVQQEPISRPSFREPDMTKPYPYPVSEDVEDEGKGLVEKLFGGNLFAKIGIVTLVLGIGFFVKYAIDQGWINEVARVAIGLAVGGIIIGLAHKLKEKYNVFSSILVGGGISVFYITITLAFREYEIFSQPVAFALLSIVTVFSVILSLLYNRQELAIFSLVGGVLAPLMVSTGEGNYIVLFSYMLILNTGMLVISLKKDWRIINIIAYLFSLLFFWTWLIARFETEYLGASVFASLFFIQFYVLAIIQHLRKSNQMTWVQAGLILTNNCSALLAYLYILNDYTPDLRGIATLILSAVNAVVMLTLFRQTKVDKNMIYLIIAVVMSFVSLAIPIQLNGYVITMFWAAETVLLLWLWQKSRVKVFYVGFLVISVLSLISYVMDLSQHYDYLYYIQDKGVLPIILNKMFITGAVLALSFGVGLFFLSREKDENEREKQRSVAVYFRLMFITLLFAVPFLELDNQLESRILVEYSDSFRYLCLATYTFIFVAVLSFIYRTKTGALGYWMLFVSAIFYTCIYPFLAVDMREDAFVYETYPRAYFIVHLLSLPAIGSIIYTLVKNMRLRVGNSIMALSWALVIISTIILSVELDNLVVMFVGNADNYYSLLSDVHTFGYPILWGLTALVLMLWGLKKKEVVLRKIALISFGLIVLKFYAYDVWQMSQVGKIISFIVLGIILLTVSFMQQKLKTLVKKDEEEELSLNQEINESEEK